MDNKTRRCAPTSSTASGPPEGELSQGDKRSCPGVSPLGEGKEIERHYCSDEACGGCAFYKYFSGVWACHYTLDTGIIRKGPITPECPYKRQATPEELAEIKKEARRMRAQAKH